MTTLGLYFSIFLGGYLIGSLSLAVLLARSKGINIFKEGSGNPGATNVKRLLGPACGYSVFLFDCLKGMVPALLLKLYFGTHPYLANTAASTVILGAVTGHSFSIFLQFRGGKGVSTAIGGMLALMPSVTIFSLLVWFSVFKITRFVSLASLCFALMLPLLAYLFAYPRELLQLSYILTIVLFLRHIPNIRRLWNGVENRFEKKN